MDPDDKELGELVLEISKDHGKQASAGHDLSTTIDLGRKAAWSKLGKIIINDAIDYIPTTYKKLKNKITNKKVKAVMHTGVDNYLVKRGVEMIGERFK